MGEHQLRIAAIEINRLGIQCEACKAEMVFNAETADGTHHIKCSNCRTELPGLDVVLRDYRELFETLKRMECKPYFVVQLPSAS